MSKQVLIDALKAIGLRAVDANQAVDTVTETIAGELRKGERFSIPGFGTFAVSNRAARMGRNPRTGEEIKIKASKGVRFKAGAKLKGLLWTRSISFFARCRPGFACPAGAPAFQAQPASGLRAAMSTSADMP